jgi:cholesterol oxidase
VAEPEHFDAVVVGSGFGGAVAALRLADAGRRVLVLERGRPYPPGSFARTPHEMRGAFWDPEADLYGMWDIWSFSSLDVVVSSGLGGGSLVYANVMLRKDEDTFVREDMLDGGREDWPVSRADLEPHYDRVEAMQRPSRYPLGHEPYSSTPKTLAMLHAANRMGMRAELPPLAVRFSGRPGADPVPGAPIEEEQPNLHGLPRSTCRLTGECDIGCNYGAKDTLDYTYLSAAKRAGALLRTCCEVRTLTRRDDRDGGGFEVGYVQHLAARDGHREDLLDPDPRPRRTITARRVVLAAGAVGTPRLLLANRAGLPGLSPAVGTRVSSNGDALGWIRNCTRRGPDGEREWRYLDPSRGPVITTSIQVPESASPASRGFHIQDAGAPAIGDWLWQALEVPEDLWRMRRTFARRVVERLRKRRDTSLSAELSELLGTTRSSAAMMPLLGMGRDVPHGRYRLRGRALELDWRPEPSEEYYDALDRGFERLARALGGEFTDDLSERFNRAITVHPCGGCPMGTDRRRGAVDPWGEVYGQPGLYVTDGSAMPGPVGPNPSFTIAAWADRVADGILEGRAVG